MLVLSTENKFVFFSLCLRNLLFPILSHFSFLFSFFSFFFKTSLLEELGHIVRAKQQQIC